MSSSRLSTTSSRSTSRSSTSTGTTTFITTTTTTTSTIPSIVIDSSPTSTVMDSFTSTVDLPTSTLSPSATPVPSASTSNQPLIIGLSVGLSLLSLIIIIVAFLLYRRKRRFLQDPSPKDRSMTPSSLTAGTNLDPEPPTLPDLNFDARSERRKTRNSVWFNPSTWFGQNNALFDESRTPTPTPTLPDWGHSVINAHKNRRPSTVASSVVVVPPSTFSSFFFPSSSATAAAVTAYHNQTPNPPRRSTSSNRQSKYRNRQSQMSHTSFNDIISRYRSFYGSKSETGASHVSDDVESNIPPSPYSHPILKRELPNPIPEDDEDDAPLGRVVGKVTPPLPAESDQTVAADVLDDLAQTLPDDDDDFDSASMEPGIGVGEVIASYDRHRSTYTVADTIATSDHHLSSYTSTDVTDRHRSTFTVATVDTAPLVGRSNENPDADAPPVPVVTIVEEKVEDVRPMSWTSQASSVPSSVLEAEAERQGFGTFGRR
ncbi:hypothetical protein BC829DRAFT_402788 [Chytridium lagenaria]|nr:hypothetical protein BC829DRAFT_402788 [Chytridium lagenaria]